MLLSYLQTIDKVEKYLSQHINYLDKYYGSGHFIASGRKEPHEPVALFFVVQIIKKKS